MEETPKSAETPDTDSLCGRGCGIGWSGILSYGGQYRAVSVSPLSPETAMETAAVRPPIRKRKRRTPSNPKTEKVLKKRRQVRTRRRPKRKTPLKVRGKGRPTIPKKYFKIQDPESGEEVMAEYAPPGGGESLSGYLLVEKVPGETSGELVQYELVPSTDADAEARPKAERNPVEIQTKVRE